MENKSLGFDYVSTLLFRNINADQQVNTDTALNGTDKQELLNVLSTIKNLSIQAQAQVNPELQQIQYDNFKKSMEFIQSNAKNTYDTMMSLKTSLQDVIGDAKKAYKYVLWMYVVAFYIGIGLIITAIVFAAYGKTILSIAFGTVGLVDIITHFVFKPPLELQNSRANLAQLMVILTNWFSDVMNLNSYYSMVGQQVTFDLVEKISTIQNKNTELMLELIEKYCEPGEHLNKKPPENP